MKFTINQIAQLLQGEVKGNSTAIITQISKIEIAQPGSITFLANPKYKPYLYTTKASAIIVQKDFVPQQPIDATLILVQDPYSSFTTLLKEYQKLTCIEKKGAESPVYLGKNSTIGKNIYQEAFSYIGNYVSIGDNVKIYPHAYIGDHVSIGNDTVIYSGVKIYEQSKIGQRCIIHAGAVMGSDGFGMAPQPDGSFQKMPQIGNVVLQDDVEVGANTTIDAATVGSTVLKQGVKIDNLVQVAHNVEIGNNTAVASQAGIAGSTKIGSSCLLGGQVGIVGHLEIGDHTIIGAQAGIIRSFKKGKTTLLGSPGFDSKKYLAAYAVFKHLPALEQRLTKLEKNAKFAH